MKLEKELFLARKVESLTVAEKGRELKEIIVTLLIWISQNSSFEITNPNEYPLPVITFISQEEIHFIVTKKDIKENTIFIIQAAYIPENNILYLPHDLKLDTLSFKSILIHELVHHIQNINDISYPCDGHTEKDAYNLEMKYLIQNGIEDPYEMMDLDPLSLVLITQCRNGIFR